jgi:hypothetical protein
MKIDVTQYAILSLKDVDDSSYVSSKKSKYFNVILIFKF